MFPDIHEYVVKQLEASKGRWPEVADGSGVPRRTIEKIARRETQDPGVTNIQKLADYFQGVEQQKLLDAARALGGGGHAPT